MIIVKYKRDKTIPSLHKIDAFHLLAIGNYVKRRFHHHKVDPVKYTQQNSEIIALIFLSFCMLIKHFLTGNLIFVTMSIGLKKLE